MKKLTEDLWLIEEGLYAELRGEQWFVSDEQSAILAGPFGSLKELDQWRTPGAAPVEEFASPLADLDSTDLVTLREAAEHLPRTHQALYAAQRRGTLKVEPVIAARTTKLYSLRALKEAYPS